MKVEQLTINNKHIKLKNMVVIVGSNGTGKTTLLNELYLYITNRKNNRNISFWEINAEFNITDQDKEIWAKSLVEGERANNQQCYYCPFTDTNPNDSANEVDPNVYKELVAQPESSSYFNNEYILRRELTHYLSVDNRLLLSSSGQMVEASKKSNNMVDLLQRNPGLVDLINKKLELFSKRLHVCLYRMPTLELKLCDIDISGPPEFKLEEKVSLFRKYTEWLDKYRISDLQYEGHGIRAFLRIMLTYFIPTSMILMIDEPEIHLYPSIKRKFGVEIGKLADSNEKQIFCVTHDSDFLQGIINSRCEATVIRLNKTGNDRTVSVVQFGKEDTSLTANQQDDNFAQIPFLDCIIIVEGAAELKNGGGSPIITKIYQVKEDSCLVSKIKKLAEELSSILCLKNKGINAIENHELKDKVLSVLEDLKEHNVFVIPNGALESWKDIECDKVHYPEKCIMAYNNQRASFSELENFLQDISKDLTRQMGRKINARMV